MARPAPVRDTPTMSDTNPPVTVTFATLTAGRPHIEHVRSTRAVMSPDSLGPGYKVLGVVDGISGPYLDIGRNQLVARLLADDTTSTSDWFIFLDDDIGFTPEHATALLDAAITHDTGCAGGPYVCFDPFYGQAICAYRAEHYSPDTHPEGLAPSVQPDGRVLVPVPLHSLPTVPTPVDSFGAGFMAVSRDLLERMRTAFVHPQEWFAELVVPSGNPDTGGLWLGEDHVFCIRAAILGSRPLLVPDARVTHYKTAGFVVPDPTHRDHTDPLPGDDLAGEHDYHFPGE